MQFFFESFLSPVGGPSLDNLVTCGCKGANTWDPETKSCMEEGMNADIEPPNVTVSINTQINKKSLLYCEKIVMNRHKEKNKNYC